MELVVRATAVFLFLWVITKAMGKRELSQMGAFDLILLVVMGDLIQQGVTADDRSVTGAVLAVSTLTLWVLLASWVTFRSRRAQTVFEGLPVVVIRDGEILPELLKLERLTAGEVAQEARQQGIARLADVRVGILESDGSFSFILRDGRGPLRQQLPRDDADPT
jgi:uncharacterized membrane protein YcaP (DUF421 family)